MSKNNKNESLSLVMGNCFGRYAKYIIQDRALPDIRDGLKPVQRRILFSMNNLNLLYNKPYKKSARTVGEVIGKYHPHGDSSIYEAMIRMSQDWKNNLPLLDVHGNNGSIDGDSPAAMRYTEARLSEVASLMLENIEKNIVEFALNFDDSEKEPVVLPSILPNLLINGSVGIAAGYATNIPTHNPSEVFKAIIYRILNSDCSIEEIMKIMPGPDFPTGGIIQGVEGIKEYFETGKGKFLISSKIEYNTSNSKLNQIIVKEIPYDTNKSVIIKQLSEIMYSEKVSGILDIRDESDKEGISIVIDVKKDRNLDDIKNYFLKNTNLQVFYSTNFVTIANKKPIITSILKAIDLYIEFAIELIVKNAKYDLEKSLTKVEIIQGLVKALDIIDEIIKIIRKSESKQDSKINLINAFGFTEVQAEAIVTLKLYRLTKSDVNELNLELLELNKFIDYLRKLIDSKKLQKNLLVKRLDELDNKFGFERKTQILKDIQKLEINNSSIIENKQLIITVSKDGYIKTFTKKILQANKIEEIGISKQDNYLLFANTFSNNFLVIITKKAKTLCIPVYKIAISKWKELGQHINEFITLDSNDEIIWANTYEKIDENINCIILTNQANIKITNLLGSLNIKQTKPSQITKLKDDEELINIKLINDENIVNIITKDGLGYGFSISEVPLLNKNASGVKAIKLDKNQEIADFVLTKENQDKNLYLLTSKSIKKINSSSFKIKKRTQSISEVIKTKDSVLQIIDIKDDMFVSVSKEEFRINKLSDCLKESNIFSIYMNEYFNELEKNEEKN